MSFNVENLFVKCSEQAKIVEVVKGHWCSILPYAEPDWGLPSSFEPLLANEPKRKIAISPSRDGWIALVESKQVVDLGLAKKISEQLDTTALVIQLLEISGESGYVSADRGRVVESHFGESDDPLGSIRQVLKKYKVPFDVILFRETVHKLSEGWNMIQKK